MPLRPILAAYNTAMYNLTIFLIPLIEPFSTNDFTLKYYLTNDNFKIILDTANNESDLRILESLYIFKNRPKLNMDSSAAPLSVVN